MLRIGLTILLAAAIVAILDAESQILGPRKEPPKEESFQRAVREIAKITECKPVEGKPLGKYRLVTYICGKDEEALVVLFAPLPSGEWVGNVALFPDFDAEIDI